MEGVINKPDKWFSYLFVLYAVVAPFSISATYIALGLIVIGGIFLLYRRGFKNIALRPYLFISFLLIYIWAAITGLITSSYSSETAFRGIKELSPIILFPIFLSGTKVEKEKIIMALLFSASFVCLLGIIQFIIPSVVYPHLRRQLIFEGEFRGFFTSHNHFGSGGFFSITTILAFALILFWQCTNINKLILWVLFLLNIVALSLTMSRAYYVSIVIVMGTMLFLKSKKLLVFGVLVFVVILSILLMLEHPVTNRIKSIVDRNNPNNKERVRIWRLAIDEITKHPIVGIGQDNWDRRVKDMYALSYNGAYINAHNVYLSMWVETGIFGLIFFFILWGDVFWILLRKTHLLETGSFDYALSSGAIYCIGNLLVAGMFEYNFVTLLILLIISFIVGLSLSNDIKANDGVAIN